MIKNLSVTLIYRLPIIEMAKAYDLNIYKYLNSLLEKRPNARTAQKELEKLAPWNEEVQRMFARKMK